MNILTIGVSPFLLLSKSKVHASIIKKLSLSHNVTSMVWFHDTSYFKPEETKGGQRFFFEESEYKIPLLPFKRGKDDPIVVYETINQYTPDIVLTVGDLEDFLFMHAVRQFSTVKFKWIFVLMNSGLPINEKNREVFSSIDGLICTNLDTLEEAKEFFKKDALVCEHVGFDSSNYFYEKPPISDDRINIVSLAKNSQSDNIATIIEVVSDLVLEGYPIKLTLHTNFYDSFGDYDLNLLKERFDPKDEFIEFPSEFVGFIDGVPASQVRGILNNADIFLSAPMVSASALTTFEALACGCWPMITDCGANKDIVDHLISSIGELNPKQHRNLTNLSGIKTDRKLLSFRELYSFPGIRILTKGETYLNICDPNLLKNRIIYLCQNKELLKGRGNLFSELITKYNSERFLNAVSKMIEGIQSSDSILILEE